MPETEDLPLKTLEALARADIDRFVSLSRQLDPAANHRANRLVSSGFFLVATRKWNAQTDTADVRAWVAELRSEMELKLGEIDPVACEKLIASTVTGDNDRIADIDPSAVIRFEAMMLFKIVYDEQMSEERLAAFLREADDMATEWEASSRKE
jgi:hypothetical protein